METTKIKKSGLAAILCRYPLRHGIILLSLTLIMLHFITRTDSTWMEHISESLIRPMHRQLARLTSYLPFSLAEMLIAVTVIFSLCYILWQVIVLIRTRGKNWVGHLYQMILTPLSVVLLVYALFCSMWGAFFYGDDFVRRSGLKNDPISVEELAAVTAYFAKIANEYSGQVARDENGFCCTDRESVLQRSAGIYDQVEKKFPVLAGPDVPVKGVCFSRVMSYLDFTGFFFPITGEANVNMDFPVSLFASTVSHEISHQRGVAKEQEANFVAVLSAMESGDADYIYSAALLAYTHLGNALYDVDYDCWEQIYLSLKEEIHKDFAVNRAYWQQFETPVQTVSNTVYESFLQSYDQHLGLKSYGACVDLLVNYYIGAALAA